MNSIDDMKSWVKRRVHTQCTRSIQPISSYLCISLSSWLFKNSSVEIQKNEFFCVSNGLLLRFPDVSLWQDDRIDRFINEHTIKHALYVTFSHQPTCCEGGQRRCLIDNRSIFFLIKSRTVITGESFFLFLNNMARNVTVVIRNYIQ